MRVAKEKTIGESPVDDRIPTDIGALVEYHFPLAHEAHVIVADQPAGAAAHALAAVGVEFVHDPICNREAAVVQCMQQERVLLVCRVHFAFRVARFVRIVL